MRRLLFTSFILLVFLVTSSWAADRLVVKNDSGTQKLTVTDGGWIGINTTTPVAEVDLGGGAITVNGTDNSGTQPPRLAWRETGRVDFGYGGDGGGNLEAYSKGHSRKGEFRFVYGGGNYGSVDFKHYNGSGWTSMMRLDKDGNLYLSDGAWSDGHTWYDGSSRELKDNINPLSEKEAFALFTQFVPVSYYYKTNKEDWRLGFIAEDLPVPVAVEGKSSVSAIDIVAVLTKVVQSQQTQLEDLQKRINLLENK